jgi:hypothetical protein
VRKVSDGPDGGRFLILSELAETKAFVFAPTGPALTMREVCDALMAYGISEQDAMTLLNEAIASFKSGD